ncbi:signal peptidase I [Herbiconiux sp. P18]|uniref:signal peptidase I n=1 Tax=Herbiconiux liangxiaofengii TaxID=3342795 RepID=UPI0035B6C743
MSESSEHAVPVGRGRSRSRWLFFRDLLIIFAIALLASVLIKTFLVRSFFIPSASMQNTLQIDDRILVNQLEPGLMPIERGDVVVFRDPGGWLQPTPEVTENPAQAAVDWVVQGVGLAPDDADNHLVKRVIGLPGDHVVCCNPLGQLTINDVAVDELSYIDTQNGSTAASAVPFDVIVPADSLWVMGDNRNNSEDSRYHQMLPGKGSVPIDDVVGRAVLITWPIGRWSWIDNHGSAFGGVPAAAPASQ